MKAVKRSEQALINNLKPGMKVCVISNNDTKGMLINNAHLVIREIGKKGIVLTHVPGHSGDVWFVKQDNGIAAYSFTELEAIGG